jgi:hypothetical protein
MFLIRFVPLFAPSPFLTLHPPYLTLHLAVAIAKVESHSTAGLLPSFARLLCWR